MKPNEKKIAALLKKKQALADKIRKRNELTCSKREKVTTKYNDDINKIVTEAARALEPLKKAELQLNVELIKAGHRYVPQA